MLDCVEIEDDVLTLFVDWDAFNDLPGVIPRGERWSRKAICMSAT
jgi:hypothetical protein